LEARLRALSANEPHAYVKCDEIAVKLQIYFLDRFTIRVRTNFSHFDFGVASIEESFDVCIVKHVDFNDGIDWGFQPPTQHVGVVFENYLLKMQKKC
jgi:hypothetical protein